jgi:uncharacterized protein YsxB (DUF464 family)
MTRVDYDPESFRMEIRGHAGAAPAGQDIVCAGISVLSYTLINAAMSVPEYDGHTLVNEGEALIRVECCPDEEHEELCREMFRVIWQGFETIAESFPQHIQLTGGYDG